ncbi:ferric reductase like transmembrane component [Xylariaceae sp. FL0594]|nr:ferric reductase like transmembrane component [Xylariaceae sp. FL0594]
MAWPYQFVTLDTEEVQARRRLLDRYGLIAQLSTFVPVVLFLLFRLVSWTIAKASGSGRGTYTAVPGSPGKKHQRLTAAGLWSARARRVVWWLGDDVVVFGYNWGPRDQIIGGIAWSIWLLVLCVVETGNDYLHLTKRFGIVGVSQFPVQYLLSLKNLNPVALALKSSHEEVNRWHRVLGRVIYAFLVLHAFFYLNFYYQNDLLGEKATSLVPVLGFIAILGMHLLYGTAVSFVRKFSYRVFFLTHLIVALGLPPIIYFHAHHASFYVWEALAAILADIATRRAGGIVAETEVQLIPDSDLVKLVGRIPLSKIERFAKNPGTHVYLSVPAASRPEKSPIAAAHLVFEFSFNPFSVAAVDESTGELTLVARKHDGPMTRAFSHFAADASNNVAVKLSFDGPYGCAKRFPNLAGPGVDRILLVAGGVGATFTLPLYRWILSENPAARVQMIWSVRSAGDATWASVAGEQKSILDDENIQVYLTGSINLGDQDDARTSEDGDGNGVELRSLNPGQAQTVSMIRGKRPDLQNIVDDTFRQGVEERVAVLVCGPEAMARELRSHVGVWVRKGRYVWWHNENFEW